MSISQTIIISCAGAGTRLGMGTTKALIDINGKPLIIKQLEQLDEYEDIRVVVGYQAERVIQTVNEYRKDILFVFNRDYKTTGTGASVSLAAKYANEYIISFDGDLLVHPDDLKAFLNYEDEIVGVCKLSTEDPVLVTTYEKDGKTYAKAFSREQGDVEWTGLVKVKSSKLQPGTRHVYQLLEPILPLQAIKIRTQEIDTLDEYEKALAWVGNGYSDLIMPEKKIDDFFRARFIIEDNYIASRYRLNNRIDYDYRLIKEYVNVNSHVLDLGCGTGIIEKNLINDVSLICGIDQYKEFLEKAYKHPNIIYKTGDASSYLDDNHYDLILSFGLIQYLNKQKTEQMIRNCYKMLSDSDVLIIKAQYGIKETVIIDKFSDELNSNYYAIYHQIDEIKSICEKNNFTTKIVDIYPKDMSRWDNTHEYALVCKKN